MMPVSVSNDSPFPPPYSATARIAKIVQKHMDAARNLFEACPISTQLRLSMAPCVPGCEDLLAEGESTVLAALPGVERSGSPFASAFGRVQQRLHERAAKSQRQRGLTPGEQPRALYVNNINSQRLHNCFRSLYGQDDVAIEHGDIIPETITNAAQLPTEVDLSQVFETATSVDVQHLGIETQHLVNLSNVTEMPVLTHVNLCHNNLGDAGVEALFAGLVAAGSSVVHVAVSSNNLGDAGMEAIARSLASLPQLTSLELCNNFIQERGSIALADVIGGMMPFDDAMGDEVMGMESLPILSVDLHGNRSRELGALRWANVIESHPTLQFLCLSENDIGLAGTDAFHDLALAVVTSPTLSVLDLRNNFPWGLGKLPRGEPPQEVTEFILAEIPLGEFDEAEVRQGVFIRRHRGGGGGVSENRGRQPQQGQLSAATRQGHVSQRP